jgi:CubicO group peptidase (beta-lactamase class C family)
MNFRKSLILLAAAALFAGATPVAAQDAHALQAEVFTHLSDAEVASRVQGVIDLAVARPEAAGLSVAVARGDHILVERGAGIADAAGNRAADTATMFRIGSVTKQFTAAAILRLVEQGKLSLDDPLAEVPARFRHRRPQR